MALSLTSRPGRGLILPNTGDFSVQNADVEKGNQLIKSTFDLLERGEKEIKFDDKHKDVILILGNTGSGKSTFTQWVAGDNTKSISKETKERAEEYVMEDPNRIGDTTLQSKTIFPKLVIDTKTNAAYYDCPGFSDTQGTSHDIVTTYFFKKVIDYSENVKMVFTINHPSVRKGVDRQDFLKLVRHVTDLVKNIEKFKSSIAIVATKVDNQHIKQNKNLVLEEDDKVIAAIADFLLEAKQYLEDNSKIANLSKRENRFYENAIKFVEVLLEKEGENYPRIGLFRRPGQPSPVSDIPLLQKNKQDIERILYEKLNFTSKNNEDFRYTVSEKSKNDINEIVEEINENLWSSLEKVAGKIQEYYRNLVKQVRGKIDLFVSEANAIDVNSSEAETFRHEFSRGCYITSEVVNKMKNLTNPEQLAVIVSNSISNLDIDVSDDDVLYIANQGKYFSVLQKVSDKVLISKPWDQLFKDVDMFISSSKTIILHDINSAAEKINNRIQINLNNIVKGIQEEYIGKIKSLEIQTLPEKLNKDRHIILKLTEEIKNGTTTGKLVRAIRYVVDDLDIPLPMQNLQSIANQGKYLKFLEVIGGKTLNVDPMMWLSTFEYITKFFYKSEKWYTFLEDLYKKFSEYDVQKDRQRYNVADLKDWGQPGKPQGILITRNTIEQFLNKIGSYNVTEYETVKNLTATGLQIEELNQVLSLTLKHRPTVRCSEPHINVKGSFISLNETMQNLISNSDTNNSCNNFKTQLDTGKYKLFKFFASNRVFVDADLSFSGAGISVAVISPKWEVIGSRSIDLSGVEGAPKEVPKAKNGAHPGNDGFNGVPGNPGGSGESFFGIGATFVGGKKLKIISNGGKGGLGQAGGDGAEGRPGRNAPYPARDDEECERENFRGFTCNLQSVSGDSYWSTVTKKIYRIVGPAGGTGGNGGSGGKGGNGGDSGKIEVLEMSRRSEITRLTYKGKEGENGKAGFGGHGGWHGDDRISEYNQYFVHIFFVRVFQHSQWISQETIYYNRNSKGSDGTDGAIAVGLQDPVPANGISRLPNLINEYKAYLRENINNRFSKSALLQFLEQLSSSKHVRNLDDTFSLIDKFQGLEEQFHKLSENTDFISFYSSLLDRISEFAKRHKNGLNSNESKKVLNYLYTATLGRIYNLRENSKSILITDIRGHLNLVKENIQILKDLQTTNNKVDVINKYKESYKKAVDKKMEEAKSLVKKHISPEIENINTEVDDQVNSLIEQIIALQKQVEKDQLKLAEKKKELQNAVARKGLFSFFRIIGGIVSFLGPLGEIAGTVIGVTSTVGESLALNNHKQTLNLPSDVVSAITSIGDQIKSMRNRKVAFLNKLLDDLSEEIDKNPEKLKDMKGKIFDIKDKLKKVNENKIKFKQVKELESELKLELKKKGDDLKIHLGDKKSIDALKVIRKTAQIAHFGSLLLNMYDQVKEDNEKVEAVTDAMEKMNDKLKKLREYEENIYDTIVPMLQEMEDHMKDIRDKLGSKSQVALDVTKWKVQSTLKDMKLQMRRLTEGFEVKDDLSRSIEKLEEVMTTLINVYDRIQSYQDQQNLANYIADISSVASNRINIKSQQLVNAVNHLEFAIRANIVLEQYRSAIDAFKQWVFPFADHFIEKPMLPSQLELNTNIQNLVQNATTEIETIKQKLDLYDASVRNSDNYLHCEEFSSRYVSSKPFFVWRKEEYGSLLSSLLSGNEVFLKADIKDSVPHKDAIKFTEIDFDFRTKNETAQTLLSEILKGFDIRAIHLGNSYYRYANKTFLITSDSVTISFSFEKNDDGMPIRSNNVYNKLKSGDLLLSPYTLWGVRIIKQTNRHSFKDLETYKNEIDVELSGFGSYVDANMLENTAVVYNITNLQLLRPKAAGVNQCKRSKYRFVRSLEKIVVDHHVTNGASAGVSSPINFLCNFLKNYFIPSAIISFNQIFDGEQTSVKNYGDSSESPYDLTDTRNIAHNVESNLMATDTDKIDTSAEDYHNHERIASTSDSILITNFDGNSSCSKSFLLSDEKDRSNNHSIQTPDLNCSLLLADLVTRTITGNRYKSPIDECLLSPREVILGKISDGKVRNESDAKQMLQRHLSEKEERPSSWFSKLNGYVKATFKFLGLVRNDDTEEYVQDVRNLFA